MKRMTDAIRKIKVHPRSSSLVLVLACLVLGSFLIRLGRAYKSADVNPGARLIWSVDLSENVSFRQRIANSSALLRPPTIDFLDGNGIIVAFDDGLPSFPNERTKKTFGFHVLAVDAQSGALGMSLSFPVNVDLSQARAVGNGKFLVLSGEQLSKYSRDFQRLASMSTPLLRHGEPTEQTSGQITWWNSKYETWQMDVAPGGDTVLLEHTPEPMHLTLRWLRSADFSEVQSMQTHTWSQIFAGKKTAVASSPNYGGPSLISPSKEVSLGSALDVAYVVSDSLVFIASQKAFKVSDTSGQMLADGKLSMSASSFARAINSERFVYATGAYDGAGLLQINKFPGVHTDVRVFDWKELKQIAEVRLHKEVGGVSSGYKQLAVALSPDGTLLAVLDDSQLSCYRLP